MPYDHEADRELFQQTFSQEWGQPACAICIRGFAPRYWVRGRQANGSPSSQNRVRRFFRFIVNTVYTIVVLAIEAVAPNSPGFDLPGATYSGRVRGREGSPAVQFADAVRRGPLWLVIGTNQLAAAKIGSSPSITVVWSAAGSQAPQLDRNGGKLRWPDGSYVFFCLDTEESQRLVMV